MKNVYFIIVASFTFLLAGCGTRAVPAQQTPTPEVNSGVNIPGVQESYPACEEEKLADVSILQMDDLVKNCTEKKEEGMYRDGLGGVSPVYVIANKQILAMSFNNDETGDRVICKENKEDGKKLLLPTWIAGLTGYELTEIPGYAITLKVIDKGLINVIADKVFPDSMWCKDIYKDCTDMIDYGGWTDGKNYFVAGFRSRRNQNYTGMDLNPDRWTYYVINNKLYFPGKTIPANGVLTQSKRNFAGIKNNKIIVRKIKNSVLIGNPQTMDITKLKSKFTLETCEIDM